MISESSQPNLEKEEGIDNTKIYLNLEFPEELFLRPDTKVNQELYAFDHQGFQLVLKIFNSYDLLSKEYPLLLEENQNLINQRTRYNIALLEALSIIKTLKDDRDYIYNLREEDIKKLEADKRKQKIKTFLWAGGTGLIGIAGGILVGLFIK